MRPVDLIIGSATLNGLPDRAKRPKHSTNKAFDKSGVYSESPKVADTMIEARPVKSEDGCQYLPFAYFGN